MNNKIMSEQEMLDFVKNKSKEEIRNFIIERLKYICEESEQLFVNDENYEKASEVLEIKKRVIKGKP